MRSRYSAYVLKDGDYLLATWAPAERPPQLNLSQDETVWLGLEILRCTAGQAGDSVGTVEFIARFRSHGELKQLHEVSRFVRSEGRWLYLDGAAEERPQPPRIAATIGRNDPCPCGSGKKSKRCCG
jgi:SEC-C motif-containing protein